VDLWLETKTVTIIDGFGGRLDRGGSLVHEGLQVGSLVIVVQIGDLLGDRFDIYFDKLRLITFVDGRGNSLKDKKKAVTG
jgi:hypothetical protein